MAFGWGFWLWSVPALALVVPAARFGRRDVEPEDRRPCRWSISTEGLLSTPVSTSSHDREPVRGRDSRGEEPGQSEPHTKKVNHHARHT
jgi:hypothetical protein